MCNTTNSAHSFSQETRITAAATTTTISDENKSNRKNRKKWHAFYGIREQKVAIYVFSFEVNFTGRKETWTFCKSKLGEQNAEWKENVQTLETVSLALLLLFLFMERAILRWMSSKTWKQNSPNSKYNLLKDRYLFK